MRSGITLAGIVVTGLAPAIAAQGIGTHSPGGPAESTDAPTAPPTRSETMLRSDLVHPATDEGVFHLSLALDEARMTVGDGFLAFVVDEVENGLTDLNGDGEPFDRVLHVFDAATRTTRSLGVAVHEGLPLAAGRHLAFVVYEGAQGQADLNGDGDTYDQVAHVYDHGTGTVTSLGLATLDAFQQPPALAVSEDLALFVIREGNSFDSGQGADLNGDGDRNDFVVHVHEFASGTTTNLGLAIPRPGTSTYSFAFRYLAGPGGVALRVSEVRQGGTDLNGDGDVDDDVLHVFTLGSGEVWNTGTTGYPMGFARGGLIANVREEEEADLNRDGDRFDSVLHRFDPQTRAAANEGLACTMQDAPTSDRWGRVLVSESGQGGTDLNGDGDAQDVVVHVVDTVAPRVTNLGLAASSYFTDSFDHGLLAFWVEEQAQGGMDLNGDGKVGGWVVHVHRAGSDTTTNLGLAGGPWLEVDGGLAAFEVAEDGLLGIDLNGDGDPYDMVIHAYDQRSGCVTNLGLATDLYSGSVGGSRYVCVPVSELEQGEQDLNGDGDPYDRVYFLYDARDGHIRNLGLAAGLREPLFGDRFVALVVDERSQGADLNGDGDLLDEVPVVVGL